MLSKSYKFLSKLIPNNNRDWFHANKGIYNEAKAEFEGFIDLIIPEIIKIDKEVGILNAKECIFRIFKDVRFSKDKTPYKINFGAYMSKGGRKSPYAGYYLHFEPGASFMGGGVYMPESANLKAIRTEIYDNVVEYKKIISKASFKKVFPEIYGEKLKTAPKGFPKDFPDLELIKNKHFAVVHYVDDDFWRSDDLIKKIIEIYKVQLPFNNFLNRAIR